MEGISIQFLFQIMFLLDNKIVGFREDFSYTFSFA